MAQEREDFPDLISFLIREAAINDWKHGLSVSDLLQRIEVFYDKEEKQRAEAEHDAPGEEDPEHASDEQEAHSEPWKRPFIDQAFSVAVWDTMRQHDDIIVGANRPGRCEITLEDVLLLPEEPLDEPAEPNKDRGKESARRQAALSPPPGASTELFYQPRVHVAQKRLWNELTGHDVDKTKLPFSEWQLLLCIVAAGPKGILQAEAGKETGQDKRSVPRRTDFLFQKGYIDKKQVLAHSQKTSLLTHKLYLDTKQASEDLPDPSKLPPQVLTQDLMPVPGHEYWTGAFVDTEMVARAAVAIIRAWGVIRRAHILAKMNITDLRMRKTLERTMRKFFELKIAKRVSAVTPDNPKIFKDCVKYLREPTDEEWSHFKKKLTSQGFKNRPSRAKPKSEHKPRLRKRASAPTKKRKKAVLDDSSDDGGRTEDGDGSDGSGDENDDFFGADEQDEGFDAAAKPAQMTSTKETRKELEAMVEEAIGAIPGGITEEDLLIELSGIAVEDLHSMFEPLNDPSPNLAEAHSIHLVQEAIFRRGQETFQYYTLTDFKRRVKAGESVWEGVAVWRPEASHASTAHNVNNAISFEEQPQSTNASAVSTPKPSYMPLPSQAIVNSASRSATPPSRPKQQRRRGRPAHTGTPSIRLNSPIKNQPGRPKRAGEEKVTFTSHDQVQRAAGIPGVYWDIPEFTIKIKGPPLFLRGRKTKKFLVLFKTDRINELDLSPKEHKQHIPFDSAKDDSAYSTPEPQPFQFGTHTMPTTRMGSPNVDISTPAETPDKSFIGLKGAPGAGHDSPYGSSPREDSMAKPRRVLSSIKKIYGKEHVANNKHTEEVSKIELSDFVVPATQAQGMARDEQAYQSPYATQNSQSVRRSSSRRASKIAMERLHTAVESYQSPYAPPTSGDREVEAAAGEETVPEDSPSIVENQEKATETGTKPKSVHYSTPLSEDQKYLDSRIQVAANEIFPGQAAQLPVIKDDIVGNLCTDMESTKVVFFPLDIMDMDHKMELDANLLSRADLDEENFRLTLIMPNKNKEAVKDTARKSANFEGDDFHDDEKIMFLFASTMLKKARGLKGKTTWGIASRALQARRDALPSWSFPVPDGGPKPFKCDTCTGSWKNYEGIKYHKTKGKTACNPDYVRPPTPPPGERRTKRKGYVDVDLLSPEEAAQVAARLEQSNRSDEKVMQDSIMDEERRPKRRAAEVARRQSQQLQSIARREPSDSEESDYEDESVAKSAQRKTISKDKTAKPMVNNGMEASSPNSKAVNAATPEKRVLLTTKRNLKYPTTNDRDNVDRRTGPIITQQRKDIIMELVEANGGSFPGDQGLWFAMHNAWMERYAGSNIQDYKYCNQAVALLEDQSLLVKLKFSFKDRKGRTRTRAVVTRMGVDPLSPEVTAIKEKIKEKFPKYYCPLEFAPSEEIMAMLEARESRPSEEERQRRMAERELLQQPKVNVTLVQLEHDESFHPRKPSFAGKSAVRRRRASTSSDEEIAFLNAPYYAPDPDGHAASEEERTIIRRSRKPRQPKTEKTYHRSASFREGQSMRMKALWASMKERGSMLRDIHTNEELFLAENALVIEESGDESEHNDELMDTYTGAWTGSSSHAALQSADSSWGIQPVSSIVKAKPVNPFTLLPEPITYMQKVDNPSWCYRPFGHGVKPIYARPSKRLTTLHETSDINTGFRPVIISTKRLYGADQRRKDSNEARGTKRARAWIHNEGVQKKKARYIDRPQLEGDMHPYGFNPENGEEIPWPDFTPLILPLNRAKRTGSIMPEWSSNPGLDTLANYFKASPCPAAQPESDGDIVMEESSASEVYLRPSAAFKDSLPIDLEAIITLATTDEYCVVEPNDDKLMYEIDAVGVWERSIKGKTLLATGSVEAGTIFVNHTLSVDAGQSSVMPVSWLPENQFTLETLPYGLLTHDPMEKQYPPVEKSKRSYQRRAPRPDRAMHFLGMQEATASDFEDIAAQNGRKHRLADTYRNAEQHRVKRVYRRAAQTKDFKTRRLTCLPMDIEGLPLPADDPNFAVAVSHHDLSGHRKRTNERNVISDANDDRLIVTVIVVRTLLGGLDQSVDWVLVSKMFPQTTMNWLHRHFNVLADKHAKRVEKLVDDFQNLYLKAYAAGELPPLDYDNVLDYDWDVLVDWTMDRTQAMATANVNLPATREKFNLNFGIADAEERIFRDSFFNPALPVHKRIANATAKNNTLPTPPAEQLIKPKDAAYRIARSWTRAASLTPEATFDAAFTDTKLRMFPDELMSDVIMQLMEGKVLVSANKGRQVPGRGFEVTDVFAAAFSRSISRAHYEEAADFKRRLDNAFRNGRTLTLEYTASEGEIMAVTNLAAHGRVVLTGEGVPKDEFGLTGGHYQTRIMDKRKLDFQIVIRSSPSYIYDTDHPMTISGALDPAKNPPPRPLDEAISLWYDINGHIIPDLWQKSVGMVLATIMARTGIDAKEVTRLCKPALEEWEVRLLIDWACNVGAVRELSPGSGIEAWTVNEWWWWIGGQV